MFSCLRVTMEDSMKAGTTENIIFHLYSRHLADRFLQVPEHVSESFSLATLRGFHLGDKSVH